MKMTLELYGDTYIIDKPDQNDFDADELKELFSQLMVSAGFPPSVIELSDGGRWEFKDD